MTRRSKQGGMNLGGCIASPIIVVVLIVVLLAIAPWLLLIILIVATGMGLLSQITDPILHHE